MKEKKEVYQENGVKEYRIVHPTEEYVLQFYLDYLKNNKYAGGTHLFDEEVVKSTAISGFEITLSSILRD